jgi:hypothetical protein
MGTMLFFFFCTPVHSPAQACQAVRWCTLIMLLCLGAFASPAQAGGAFVPSFSRA